MSANGEPAAPPPARKQRQSGAKSLHELVEEQCVKPLARFDDLFGAGKELWTDEGFAAFLKQLRATRREDPRIIRVEGICGGEPVVDGLRVTVRHVARLHLDGESAKDIAETLGISEAQVFHALSFFADHRAEVMELMAQEEQAHERLAPA